MHLVEEAIDGCWIGHRARTELHDSGIGSVYSPPGDGSKLKANSPVSRKRVESIIDIGYRRSVRLFCSVSGQFFRVDCAATGLGIKVREGWDPACSDELVW